MPAVLTHGHPGLCAEVKEGCLMSFSVSDIWEPKDGLSSACFAVFLM